MKYRYRNGDLGRGRAQWRRPGCHVSATLETMPSDRRLSIASAAAKPDLRWRSQHAGHCPAHRQVDSSLPHSVFRQCQAGGRGSERPNGAAAAGAVAAAACRSSHAGRIYVRLRSAGSELGRVGSWTMQASRAMPTRPTCRMTHGLRRPGLDRDDARGTAAAPRSARRLQCVALDPSGPDRPGAGCPHTARPRTRSIRRSSAGARAERMIRRRAFARPARCRARRRSGIARATPATKTGSTRLLCRVRRPLV